VQIGKRHETQLEDTKWTDKVFTGDNFKTTAKLSLQARDRNEHYNMDVKKRRVKEKENQDKEASSKKPDSKRSQSSKVKMSGAKKPLQGLEGVVDVQKVKDFRKAIRRRYASRSNFQKIY
jgi:DNA polymerase II small subunit/DNA polymerase delta subunit B